MLRRVASSGEGELSGGMGRWADKVLVERRELSCAVNCTFCDSRARTGWGLAFVKGRREGGGRGEVTPSFQSGEVNGAVVRVGKA